MLLRPGLSQFKVAWAGGNALQLGRNTPIGVYFTFIQKINGLKEGDLEKELDSRMILTSIPAWS